MSESEPTEMAVDIKRTWGNNIRAQRLERGISQQRLAEVVGVDQSVVSYWEHGHKAPTVERQLAIAKALGISVRVLFQFPEVA